MLRTIPPTLLLSLALGCGGGQTASSPTSAPSTPTIPQGEGLVEAADGVPISYEVLGAGEPALVFVHCWACNRSFWREQAPVFAADHTVVLLDLPGHGASGRDRAEWTLQAYADDVVRVVDHLGLDHVVLVGHSMGGPVSVMAAPALGDRLDGILCADTLHDAEFEFPAEALAQWQGAVAEDYEGAMAFGVTGMVPSDEALRQWVLAQALEADRTAMTALIPQFASFDLAAAFQQVDAPVRCVNAAPYSDMSLPTAIETNRRYVDFDAVLMEGVGHYLQLERPAEFNEKMREMLAAIEAARD